MNKNSILYKTLARALSIKRPHNTAGTMLMNSWLQINVPDHLKKTMWVDKAGNIHIDARTNTSINKTLFVAHVDTVHSAIGANKITKTRHSWHADGAPLGADDGAGIAVLMHLMHKGVAAYYVFTQGEECGGIGATHLATHHAALLGEFDRAIAFDRRGTDSVITYQYGGRCCSNAFAETLSEELNMRQPEFMYSPDDTGVYTDTAEFVDIIPECTNISVGYYKEHTVNECLDIVHLKRLARAAEFVKWDKLPVEREAGVTETKWGKAYQSTVWSLSGELYDYADVSEGLEIDELYDALDAAWSGDKPPLIKMICIAAYPEDPNAVEKLLDTDLLTLDMLEDAYDMAETYPPHEVKSIIFDELCVRV